MKKVVLFIALVLGLASSRQAVGAGPRWGARVSYELACPGDVKFNKMLKGDVFGNNSGLSFGVVYNMPMFFNLYFEPGLSLYYNTYSMNKDAVNGAFASDPELAGLKASSASVRMWGLRLPLNVGYKFTVLPALQLSLFTGPEFCLGLSAKSHLKVSSLTVSESEYGKDGPLNRPDVKWRFGVGATFMDHFYGAVSGAVGMCDQVKDDYKMKSNLFDITVGYNF
ncbi:MAG: PorT family protein [Firmicutes bacterium]|nr:PorT family protein [Bacillota bacterium]MCM1401512.1 PorT family protein [Bacteroides sp.]MCM1477362.1 PorT family protein [Bacteroides sp.]